MRVYLAGPISLGSALGASQVERNLQKFHIAAIALRERGYTVANPAENEAPENPTWENWMKLGLAQMLGCDAVALLPNWSLSRGAKVERSLARELGLKIALVDEFLAMTPDQMSGRSTTTPPEMAATTD